MPTIASYVNEILTEDRLNGRAYNAKIMERIESFNGAQLQRINNHIAAAAASAKFKLWKNANEEIRAKMSPTLKRRVDAIQKDEQQKELAKLQKRQKEQRKQAKKSSAVRVISEILNNAKLKAKEEVKEAERIRQIEEKREVARRVFEAETRKWRNMRYLAVGFLVCFIVPIVVVSTAYILAPILVVVFGVTCYLAYRFHKMAIIVPYVMTEDELDNKITTRQNELKEEALKALREKELKFQERLLQEKMDRRIMRLRRKREAIEKAHQEHENKLAWDKQQQEMAEEIMNEAKKLLEEDSEEEDLDELPSKEVVHERPVDEISGPFKCHLHTVSFAPTAEAVKWNSIVRMTVGVSYSEPTTLLEASQELVGTEVAYALANHHHRRNRSRTHSNTSQQSNHSDEPFVNANAISRTNTNESHGQGQIPHRSHRHSSYSHYYDGVPVLLQSAESVVIKFYTTAKYDKVIFLGEVRLNANALRSASLQKMDANVTSNTLAMKAHSDRKKKKHHGSSHRHRHHHHHHNHNQSHDHGHNKHHNQHSHHQSHPESEEEELEDRKNSPLPPLVLWDGAMTVKAPLHFFGHNASGSGVKGEAELLLFDDEVLRYYQLSEKPRLTKQHESLQLADVTLLQKVTTTTSTTSGGASVTDNDTDTHTTTLFTSEDRNNNPVSSFSALEDEINNLKLSATTASQPVCLISVDIAGVLDSSILGTLKAANTTGPQMAKVFISATESSSSVVTYGHSKDYFSVAGDLASSFAKGVEVLVFSNAGFTVSSEASLHFQVFIMLVDGQLSELKMADIDAAEQGLFNGDIEQNLVLIGGCTLYGDEVLYKLLPSRGEHDNETAALNNVQMDPIGSTLRAKFDRQLTTAGAGGQEEVASTLMITVNLESKGELLLLSEA